MKNSAFTKKRKNLNIIFIIICSLFGSLFLFIIIPLIINKLYNMNFVLVYTDWGAAEALAFYGSVLTFLGTTILGFFTVKLSKEANRTNMEMKAFQEKIEKEKIVDLYYQYIESLGLIYDLYYVLGTNLQKSEMEVYATIKNCYSKAEMIRKRLIILDFPNSNHSFFEESRKRVEKLLRFRNEENVQSVGFVQRYKEFCINQEKDFNEESAEFICDIYNSIFNENSSDANT